MGCLFCFIVGVVVWIFCSIVSSSNESKKSSRTSGKASGSSSDNNFEEETSTSDRAETQEDARKNLVKFLNITAPDATAIFVIFARCNRDTFEARKNILRKGINTLIADEEGRQKGLLFTKEEANEIYRKAQALPYGLLKTHLQSYLRKIYRNRHIIDIFYNGSIASNASEEYFFEICSCFYLGEIFDICRVGTTEKDIEFLDLFAQELFPSKFQDYLKKRNEALPPILLKRSYASSEIDLELGLTPKMSREEKLAQLSKLYREWNAKKNSQDPGTRENARKMTELIAKKRAEIQNRL